MFNGGSPTLVMSMVTWQKSARSDILSQQKTALLKAYTEVEQGYENSDVINTYRRTLVPSITALHSIGYPIISFYIDHIIYTHIRRHRYETSVLETFTTYLSTSRVLADSCLQKHVQHRKQELCGVIHVHNKYDEDIRSYDWYDIHIPHFFYTQLHILEVILVGWIGPYACLHFQSFEFFYDTLYPFYPNVVFEPGEVFLRFCGSRPPFVTILPGNRVQIRNNIKITNYYASLKLKYTAVDMLVSITKVEVMYFFNSTF